jgi:asparagine synthetase B (glutamine-hydrolysing)
MRDAIWGASTADPRHLWSLEHEDARAAERGMEFRYPFLSWALLSLTMSVPLGLRQPRPFGRVLHRLAMEGAIPEETRLRAPFVFFNQANMLNCQKAQSLIERLTGGTRWLSGDFIDRSALGPMLRSSAAGRNEPFTFAVGDFWRLLRDAAALEAWLGQFSC